LIPSLIRPLKFFLIFAPLVVYWSLQPTLVRITGLTMGTSYTIQAYMPRFGSASSLKKEIDNRLIALNKSMSTWDKDSEISKFNDFHSLNNFVVSEDFFKVMQKAYYVYDITDAAWDGTVEPILELMGFSMKSKNIKKTSIKKILANIGFDKIQIIPPNILKKKNKNITINLSSIAKGYGVDEIAKLLDKKGIKSYFVEIGGEIFARNKKYDGNKWRIGISAPVAYDIEQEVVHIVELDNKAIATSGDYRNFIKINNKQLSHIINPKTGLSVQNNITSVSVIASNTMLADALATSFMVMGIEKSLKLCEKLDGVETFIISKDKNNTFSTIFSSGFPVSKK